MSYRFQPTAKNKRPSPARLSNATGLLQRRCACDTAHGLAGQCEECNREKLTLQRQASEGLTAPASVPANVHEVLSSAGEPLDTATREFVESSFGHDFSRVRVHTDTRAAESAHTVNALAYTVGSHVVFGEGRYEPTTKEGKRLLAHELTHVVQQRNINGLQELRIGESHSEAEQEADAAAQSVLADQAPAPITASGIGVQRDLGATPTSPESEPVSEKSAEEVEALAAYIKRGTRMAPKNADLILPEEALAILDNPDDPDPFYIPSRGQFVYYGAEVGRIHVISARGRVPGPSRRHEHVISVIFEMNGAVYHQPFTDFNQLIFDEVFDIIYVNTRAIARLVAQLTALAGKVMSFVPHPAGRLGRVLEEAGEQGLQELDEADLRREGYEPGERKFGDVIPDAPDPLTGGIPGGRRQSRRPLTPTKKGAGSKAQIDIESHVPKGKSPDVPEPTTRRADVEETTSTTKAAAPASARENVVHEKARQINSEVKLDDGVHGVAVSGTGAKRDFDFCSPDCSVLGKKIKAIVDVLPADHPSRRDLDFLGKKVQGVQKDLKSGRISEAQADKLSQEFATELRNHADDPIVGRLLEMSPKEIASKAAAIKKSIKQSADIAEVREEKTRVPEKSTRSTRRKKQREPKPETTELMRQQPGEVTGGENLPVVTGQWFPQKRDPATGRSIPETKDVRVAPIPGQIAAKLRKIKHFKSFRDFRETFWMLIVNDPVLGKGWSKENVKRMAQGLTPYHPPEIEGGPFQKYELNHKQALEHAGELYNLDNIEIVAKYFHGQIGED